MMRDVLILFGAGLAANWIAESWILKASPDDPKGFVLIAPGFGMDDVARAATFAGVAVLFHYVVPGRK